MWHCKNASGTIMREEVLNKQKKKKQTGTVANRNEIRYRICSNCTNWVTVSIFPGPTAVKIGITVFREGTQCNMPQVNKCFRQTMKMEEDHSSETLVHIFQSTRRHCREDRKSDSRRVPKSLRIAFV